MMIRPMMRRCFSKIPTELIRKLRDLTGAPIVQCKEVLTECGGDLEKASGVLRERNLIQADKRSSHSAEQGVVVADTSFGRSQQPQTEGERFSSM